MDNLETLCYLQEQTSYQEDYKDFGFDVFGEGIYTYLIFPAILHSFGVLNRNGREYDADNIWNCICTDEAIQHYLSHNNWMGEIDHPNVEKQGEELSLNRISNPNMEKSSHFIRKPFLTPDKKLLKATIQTDCSTEAGRNMTHKILEGKVIPSFSARVLGALQRKMNRPVVNVRKLITYDFVAFPSHREADALIVQKLQEAANVLGMMAGARIIYLSELAKLAANNDRQVQWLCESFDITENDLLGVTDSGNSVVLTESGNVYIQPISDKNIRNKTRNMVQDWINK